MALQTKEAVIDEPYRMFSPNKVLVCSVDYYVAG